MRFSRLKLNGFKSFVDPTDLIIADGLTGVVGPNGCGKSNLLEALRWVMGENRPTAMRGGGMEDVIFSGAATRPARNFAEVALLIDNESRLAPTSFNDNDQLEIVRRITRDAGSAYKTNGKDVRARDVQMLFADASSGAHSPALVRQGQISELINAKPKARRRVLEEAAGISGLYQRRHEAELKLNGAEGNLGRVDDVIEQLATQLASLERQAKQAGRYREISAELRRAEGIALYLRWREAEAAHAAAIAAMSEVEVAAAAAERVAQEARRARELADEALPPKREEATIAAAVLQRVQVEQDGLDRDEARARDVIASLQEQAEQLERDIGREGSLGEDAQLSTARLHEERAALEAAGAGEADAVAEAEQRADAATAELADREAKMASLTEEAARLAARHQAAERRLEDADRAVVRHDGEAQAAGAAAVDAETKLTQAQAESAEAQSALEATQDLVERADATLTETESARAQVQAQEGEARAALSETSGRAKTLGAQVQALSKLLERERGEQPQALDQMNVAPGFEDAVGAALADDLSLPLTPSDGESGWRVLPPLDTPLPLPENLPSLAQYADFPDALQRRLQQIGVVEPSDGARLQPFLQPGQRLVSRAGDLWRWDGFVKVAADISSAAGRRLQQANELAALSDELEHAEQAAARAGEAHERLAARLAELTEADSAARRARRAAEARMTEASRTSSRADAECNILNGKLETLRATAARHAEERATAEQERQAAQSALNELGSLDEIKATVADAREATEAARLAMIARRTNLDELRRDQEARTERLGKIQAELADWQDRSASAEARIAELQDRHASTEAELSAAEAVPDELAERRKTISESLKAAETRKAAAEDILAGAEAAARNALEAERTAERAAADRREDRARLQAVRDAAGDALSAATDRISEEAGTKPDALLASLEIEVEQMPPASRIDADVNRLKRQRDALGAVNLRAEEDAEVVRVERDALLGEKSDLEAAIAKLRSGIAALNKEGRQRLLDAFEEVNKNFSTLFRHLFGGGEAKLVLVESDDPLEAGLEILCQPPGKKLSTLSLLSGGEQTLTALALIFAVFLANPAPICVLDEVDAPLDDANVTRFCDLLDEMCRRTDTRFLIITHHAVTMSRMDRLFGVTMVEQGVSQLVSVDLNKAEQMVA